MKKGKTADKEKYLYASGRVRALETALLTPERVQRLIDATVPDAYRLLSDCGYDLSGGDVGLTGSEGIYAVSHMLNTARESLYELADRISNNRFISGFFRARIDCHNIKALLKGDYLGTRADALMLSGGNFDKKLLTQALASGKYSELGPVWEKAAAEAREVLSRTGDGQLSDFVVDIAMQEACESHAISSGSQFLTEYSKFLADSVNLKAAVRLLRVANGAKLADYALSENGSVAKKSIIAAMEKTELVPAFSGTGLSKAAQVGQDAYNSASDLSEFERELERADRDFFAGIKYIGYGPEVIIAYINAREREFSLVRTVMSGKMTGVSHEVIKKRLGIK